MTLTGHIVGTKGNTGRGIASIVENADYTITINLTDGTSYTTAPIAGFTAVDFDENYDLVVTKTDGTEVTVETDLGDYEDLLAGYKSDAESAKADAESAQTYAETAKSGADASALKAEQWAKGTKNGTPVTSGDDGYQDNSKYYKEQAASSASSASSSASSAGTDALKSEGYAVGKQNGTDVSSGSDYYHNNAKYYSEEAYGYASDALTSENNAASSESDSRAYAIGKRGNNPVTSSDPAYHNNSKYYSEQASTSASGASSSATSASTNALKAEGYAVGKQNGTDVASGSPYYENNAKYFAEQAEDSAEAAAQSAASLTVDSAMSTSSTNPVQNKVIKGALDTKAEIDGYYESLGSGTADQLASNIYEEDSVPYNFRTSGGSIDIGDRETDMLVGGTVAWNQLVQNGNFADGTTGWLAQDGSISVNANVLTYTMDGKPTKYYNSRAYTNVRVITGHKYIIRADVMASRSGQLEMAWLTTTAAHTSRISNTANVWSAISNAVIGTESVSRIVQFCVGDNFADYDTGDTINVKNVNIFDLTAMFGSTIADYIYSLEQANAGAGVAWFKKLFPKPYYEYNAGELMSVQASSHDMVGFNQWDEEWEVGQLNITNGDNETGTSRIRSKNYIPCLPNMVYGFAFPLSAHLQTGDIRVFYYDADKNFITYINWIGLGATFTTPSNAYYLRFYTNGTYGDTYNHDICINLSWDGERDGEYEEYVKHSYPLDSSLTLRGIPKLDASNNLYYDGDTYESDGTVTRKYGVVDLGTLNWTYYSDYQMFYANVVGKKPGTDNLLCSKYKTTDAIFTVSNDKAVGGNGSNSICYVRDTAYTDAASFKTAMSGVYLVYELATPTTETADAYTNPQIVDDFGTEEYIDYAVSQGDRDVSIPVGHYTQYMANLKAKLEMSPNSPEGAGDYIVRQTNGENEYVTLASNATIQDIIARLEALEGGE